MKVGRERFYTTEDIYEAVEGRMKALTGLGEPVDHLTFVPDGEPTLDLNLGSHIDALRDLRTSIAVISNSSLIWMDDVRDELARSDWVSLKVDAVTPAAWRGVNRPHGSLGLSMILEGIETFSESFPGELVTETMLVRGVNDNPREIDAIASFIAGLHIKKSYISIPTRPPAEGTVEPPGEDVLNAAYQSFGDMSIDTELLMGYEGNAFAFSGDFETDLLGITSVHPMKEDAVRELLRKAGGGWRMVEDLLTAGALVEVEYGGDLFYMRKIPGRQNRS
jgi:wyosine [tRNA(Phe)-imidazoG37] synthetase (radical SAM superfamily)